MFIWICMGGEENRICLWVLRKLVVGKVYIFDELRFEMVFFFICMFFIIFEV